MSPDVLVKGEDYKDKVVVGAEGQAHGGQVVLAPLLEVGRPPGSSSAPAEKLRAATALRELPRATAHPLRRGDRLRRRRLRDRWWSVRGAALHYGLELPLRRAVATSLCLVAATALASTAVELLHEDSAFLWGVDR